MNARLPIALAVLGLAGCGGGSSAGPEASQEGVAERPAESAVRGPEPKVSVPDQPPPRRLVVRQLRRGAGPRATAGDELVTQFVAVRYVSGEKFESSWERGRRPFSFELGEEEANPGFEVGLRGMRVGGRRKLIVPPAMISRFGAPPGAGPEDALVYIVDLVELRR